MRLSLVSKSTRLTGAVTDMVLIKSADAETNSTLAGPLAPLETLDARAVPIGTRIATARIAARITASILAFPTHVTLLITLLISFATSLSLVVVTKLAV